MASGSVPYQSIKDVTVDGSQAAVGIFNGPVNFGSHEDLNRILNSLPTAVNAQFNTRQRDHDPAYLPSACLPDTRVDLLQKIYNWAEGENSPSIFWLHGMAGTGKSTIARTVAGTYSDRKCLGASFFFSRGGGDLGHAGKFVTSIAVQLAYSIPALKRTVCDVINHIGNIANQPLRDQWRDVILNPLRNLEGNACHPSYILVVDALDECENENDIGIILQLLADARLLETIQLRVFLTSRPEVSIQNSFRQIPKIKHRDFVLHDISPYVVSHDIGIFLEYSLNAIAREYGLSDSWPGKQIIKKLVQSANALFIWAATACRFIDEGRDFAADRLSIIFKEDSADGSFPDDSAIDDDDDDHAVKPTPEQHLDALYTAVLQTSIRKYKNREGRRWRKLLSRIIGTIVILFSPLSTQSLSKLLGTPQDKVHRTLSHLHAIIDIPNDQVCPIRLHHPSFRDFLLDSCRNREFQVKEQQAHQALTINCIQLMSKFLKMDICGVGQPGALVTDVGSSQVEQYLPQEIQYACLHWIQHLEKGGFQPTDDDQVHQFLQQHLLHWLEALGWMEKISEGIHAIISLESMTASHRCPQLFELVHDMKRFILYSRSAIELAPIQTYCSALVFAPTMSIVRKKFEHLIPSWIRRMSGVPKDWSPLLLALQGHSGLVSGAVFSPDGKQVASASWDKTVRLWDVSTGATLQTLEGHSEIVNAVAFSPDSKQVASVSDDKTIRLWNTSTGAEQLTLIGHSECVRGIAFSPDGKQVASASYDKTVRLWDASTGAEQLTLIGHSECVRGIAFSPDGKQVASASYDKTVRLWDTSTGSTLQTLKGHSDDIKAVAYSPDGKQVASASDDQTVGLWDAYTGVLLHRLLDYSHLLCAVAFSPNSKQLASVSYRRARLWDTSTGAALQTLKGDSNWANAAAFSPDGNQLASSDYQMVILWDTATGARLRTLKGHSNPVNAIAFSPDGKQLMSSSIDNMVMLWDTAGAGLQTHYGYSGSVSAIVISPDGKQIAIRFGHTFVQLLDTATGVTLHTLEGRFNPDIPIAFSSDSKQLALISWENVIGLWDTATGAVLQMFQHQVSPASKSILAVALLPDSRQLASVPYFIVRLWDAATGAARRTLRRQRIISVAFSQNGKLLASVSNVSNVSEVMLWDAATGTALRTLRGQDIISVAFSQDGKQLALVSNVSNVSNVSEVMLWNAATGAALRTLQVDTSAPKISSSIDGYCLETDTELVHLTPSFRLIRRTPNLQRISVKGQWVARGTENLLWLHPDCWSSTDEDSQNHVAIREGLVVLGHGSGRMTILELSFQ